MTVQQASHYRVVCSRCRGDAVVCPKRATDLDMWERAVIAFERAGWKQDIDHSRRSHGRNDVRNAGGGTWYCPDCRGKVR